MRQTDAALCLLVSTVAEGSWLEENADGAYSGSSYHNVPLLLLLHEFAAYTDLDQRTVSQIALIVMDVFCALLLYLLPIAYRRTQSHEWSVAGIIQEHLKRNPTKNAVNEMVTLKTTEELAKLAPAPSRRLPLLLSAAYLLNPLSIMSCVAMSLQIPLNLMVIAAITFSCLGWSLLSALFQAVAIYMSPYLLVLVLPLAMLGAGKGSARKLKMIYSVLFVASLVWTLLFLSYLYIGGSTDYLLDLDGNYGWSFLDRVYGFQFFVEDLQPNIGVSWYFHTEVFQHFRLLFLFVFQYHVFLYTIPICYKFADYPMTACWLLLTLVCLFKPYPSLGDVVLFLSIFPVLSHLLNHMSYKSLVATAGVVCICLLPVMWRMWIWTGTGNANFYFAICVGIAMAGGLFVTDAMESVLIRKFLIKKTLAQNKAEVAAAAQ